MLTAPISFFKWSSLAPSPRPPRMRRALRFQSPVTMRTQSRTNMKAKSQQSGTKSQQSGTKLRKPRILLAASGSVVAIQLFKFCHRLCEWAEVRAVATKRAMHFIDRALIPSEVALYTDDEQWKEWNKLGDKVCHIELRQWADAMVIVPLSANTLGKIAMGLCDNLLTCLVRGWDYNKKPLFVAPSMSRLMWSNPFTACHIDSITKLGIKVIMPDSDSFMVADPWNIMNELSRTLNTQVRLIDG
ncbi:hypothetical protein AMTRI_Chr05g74120 [Amborella trichopoda]|nr:probable phosphopantothenoylcysteine decarboxylase isoform X1 [Amborella trichopoda]|eukprot:XP_020521415.1 probable phosphopantothenoylcysteine decarboxylase isoform X1 [Amborella trichopoda]